MLNRVDVMTRRGLTLTLNMGENDSGYAVKDIDGLQPVKAELVSTGYAGVDGEQFQVAKRGPRNIKMKLDLEPDFSAFTYTDLREKLYDYFMPKSQITLRFYQTTGLYVDIVCIVEDFDTPLFDQDPDIQISLMGYLPDFIDPRTVQLTGNTVSDLTERNITYPGTVETGVKFTLLPNRSLSAFTLYNTTEDGMISQLDFSASLLSGDQLVINTNTGSKGIILTRAGVSSSYLYGRTAQSNWIQLLQGLNKFRPYAPGAPIPYQLEYSVRYGAL